MEKTPYKASMSLFILAYSSMGIVIAGFGLLFYSELVGGSPDKQLTFITLMVLLTMIMASVGTMLGTAYQLRFINWKNSKDCDEIKKAASVSIQTIVQQQQQDPIAALKLRLVNGEITEDEYLRKKKLLES